MKSIRRCQEKTNRIDHMVDVLFSYISLCVLVSAWETLLPKHTQTHSDKCIALIAGKPNSYAADKIPKIAPTHMNGRFIKF